MVPSWLAKSSASCRRAVSARLLSRDIVIELRDITNWRILYYSVRFSFDGIIENTITSLDCIMEAFQSIDETTADLNAG